ncbi:hypothetical protein Ahy_B10g101886 [Arachis hypogaea]|uniref:CCHC-type domain-containing protein n=1 Tax=Arachis hypogaea TaxID=3818 RepID=A0A444X0P7_ARAHY|nr:hypothetical protein Ahy_B10g101886 [Arachis hypogaea]
MAQEFGYGIDGGVLAGNGEGTANLVVYRNGEIIRNTHEGVRFVCQNPFSFVVACTMTLMELQNDLCQNIENSTLMRVSRILYRNPVVVFGGLIQFDTMSITDEMSMQNMFQIHRQTQMRQPQIELYVEFETVEAVGIQNDLDIEDDRTTVYEVINSDSEEDFEATYEAGDEDEDGDVGVEAAAENVVIYPSSSQPMYVPLLCLSVGVAVHEDGEFRIGMEYSSRKSVVAAIRSYTISRGVDYDVYNDRHTCTIGTISQDHSKLDSDTVAEAIRPLVETDSSIKVKSIIAEVQSRFNYTISHRKAWLAKQKSIAKVFGGFEDSYQALPWWLSVMVQKMPGSVPIEANMQQAGNIVLHRFDRRNEVERLSCRHVIACCANQRLDWQLYVHDVYKMTEVCKVYRFEFTPLGDPEIWPAYEGPTLVVNPALRQTSKGRPKLTRYLNEMDSRDMRGPRICRLCGAQGHSRSRCLQRAGPSGAGEDDGPRIPWAISTDPLCGSVDTDAGRIDPSDCVESVESGGCPESGDCADSAESGGCAESGDCPESGGCADSAESGDCPECDGYHDCGPVAVVYNKETAQTLHAEVDPEVQVVVVQVAVDVEERTPTISADVHTSPRTNPGTPPSVKSPRLEGGAATATDYFSCWPTPLSMPHAKLSSHEATLREERCNAGLVECPLLRMGEVVHTQTEHHSVRRVPFETLER